MAIYHFTAKVVSRGKGQSAVAKAAYNSRERLLDERTGEVHDYRRKGGIAFSGIFAPEAAPLWAQDRAQLFNEIERHEKRKDAQLVREVEIGLPYELTSVQRERLVKDYVREQFVRKGMLADVSIHAPDKNSDERNHHAHILLTMREIGPDGFGDKIREWNSREQLEDWREAWERTANRYLEKHGHEERIDRRTLEAQGIGREPTTHRGPQVNAMERDGVETDRGAQWRETNERNAALAELKFELSALENEIRVTELEAYLDQVDRGKSVWDDALYSASIEKEKVERRFAEPLHRREDIAEALGNIRAAYEMSDNAESFRTTLADRGLWLARADVYDVRDSEFNHGRLEREGRFIPVFEFGEYVAVDCIGRTFALNSAATGEGRMDVADFLSDLKSEAIPSIGTTRAEFLPERAEQTYEPYDSHRAHEAPEPLVSNATNRIVGGLGKALEAAVTAMEGLFDYGSRSAVERRREPSPKVDLQRYLADDDYRSSIVEREIEDRSRREREYYEQQRERER